MRPEKLVILLIVAVIVYRLFYRKTKSMALDGLTDDPEAKELLQMEKYIHPDIKQCCTKEIGPKNSSIYAVPFFKPEYCQMLINVAERYGNWDSKSKGDYEQHDEHPDDGKGMTLSIDFIPGLKEQYSKMVKKYLFPCSAKLFPSFKPTHHDEVYMLRYRADHNNQQGMAAHYDGEPLACILSLNSGFAGGGTYFPKLDFTAKVPPGVMLLYPGGLSHLHSGKKITSGRRYVMLHALYDKVMFY